MKLVVCHNIYRQRGGEERVLEDEEELLRTHGHHVVRFTRDSMSITHEGNLRLAVQTIWNRRTASELYDLVRRERAEVVHFHNTVPLISPAAYYAAKKGGRRRRSNTAQLSVHLSQRNVFPQRSRMRGLPGQSVPLAGHTSWVLSQQSCGERRPLDHAVHSPDDWNVRKCRRCIHCLVELLTAEAHRGRYTLGEDRVETQLCGLPILVQDKDAAVTPCLSAGFRTRKEC